MGTLTTTPVAERRLRVTLALVAGVVAFEIGRLLLAEHNLARHLFVNLGWTFASATAACALVRSGRLAQAASTRRGLFVAAAGCGAWTVGMLIWMYDEHVRGWLTPFPSIADAFFMSLPVCLAIAFSLVGAIGGRVHSIAIYLTDALTMFLVTTLFLVVVFSGGGGWVSGMLPRAVALGHTIAHLGALGFAALALATSAYPASRRRVLRLFVWALAPLSAVEVHYARGVLDRTYEAGDTFDVAWVVGFAILVAAAFEHEFDPGERPEELQAPLNLDLHLPIAAAAVGLGLLRYGENMSIADVRLFAWLAFALSIVSVTRSVIAAQLELRLRREARERDLRVAAAQRLEAVGLLAGGLAHDFNNLLTSVLAHAGVARRKKDPLVLEQSLDVIEHATLRAAHLSRRLLGLARPREPSMAATDPAEIVRRTASMARAVCREGVQLDTEVSDDVPVVLLDAGQIEQALLNLALNAIHAVGDAGSVHLSVRVEAGRGGREVVFAVADDGAGIPTEVQGRLFSPFVTTREPTGGHGLGLMVVRTVADSHGGRLTVRSRPGEGSTFALSVPCIEAAQSGGRTSGAHDAHGGYETIVVVDDQPAAVLALAASLELGGYRVISLTDAREVLPTLRRVEAPMVVTDADMPLMHGRDLVRQLRAERPDTRIVVVSAGQIGEFEALGVDAVLAKPFTVTALLTTVRGVLDDASEGRRGVG